MVRDVEQPGVSALGVFALLGALSMICCGGLGALQPLLPTTGGVVAVAPAVQIPPAPTPLPALSVEEQRPSTTAPIDATTSRPIDTRTVPSPRTTHTPAPVKARASKPGPQRSEPSPPVVAPAPGPVAPIEVSRANVFVEGDASRVVARGAGGSFPLPGSVPMGSYEIEVVFDGEPFVATSMLIVDEDPRHVVCRASLAICKVR